MCPRDRLPARFEMARDNATDTATMAHVGIWRAMVCGDVMVTWWHAAASRRERKQMKSTAVFYWK
jgi:hypothetical protein